MTSIQIANENEGDDCEVIEIDATPCSMDSVPANGNTNMTLRQLLTRSASIERALLRLCHTKEFEHPSNGSIQKLYSFDITKAL